MRKRLASTLDKSRLSRWLRMATLPMLLMLAAPELSRADEGNVYRPLDTMLAAYQAYSTGVRNYQRDDLAKATQLYQDCLAQIEGDEVGLGQRYEEFIPKAQYMTGWSFFRRAEITGNDRLWDSSLAWFRLLPLTATNDLGRNAAYMAADLEYRAATNDRFEMLCGTGHLLAAADAERLRNEYRLCQSSFRIVQAELLPTSALYAAVQLKLTDIEFDLATLDLVTHIDLNITDALGSVDYDAIPVDVLTDADHRAMLRDLTAYGQAELLLCRLLISQDSTLAGEIGRLDRRWSEDRLIKEASLQQGLDHLPKAAKIFERATGEGVEASYWQGMAYLIISTDASDLDELRTNTRRSLQRSLSSLQDFIRDLTSRRMNIDHRLASLGARAEHLLPLLKIALGQPSGQDSDALLGRDDIRFLIRVAAATGGNTGQRCLTFLQQHLETVLTKVTPGPRTAPRSVRGSFLDCTAELSLPLTHQEALFYKGMVHALQAETTLDDIISDRAFAQTAEAMDLVAEPYRGEAQYVRARALVRAGRDDEAQDPLRWLVENQHSLRAAYWYGANLRSTRPVNDTVAQNISEVMRNVVSLIEQAGTPLEYQSFLLNARAMNRRYPGSDSIAADLQLGGLDLLNCPESLSVDTSGLWPELIFYETLAEAELIRREFAQRGRRELLIYGPPHKTLYPTSTSCDDGARFLPNRLAPIPDAVHVDDRWQARIAFIDGHGTRLGPLDSLVVRDVSTDTTVATNWNDKRQCHTSGPGIPVSRQLEVTAYAKGYHPTQFAIASYEPGVADFTIGLAEVTSFAVDTVQECSTAQDCLMDKQLRNQAIPSIENRNTIEAFALVPSIRDLTFDAHMNRHLAVVCKLPNSLLVFPDSGDRQRITMYLTLTESLVSPEGIAVDSDGNIYVVDWGGHQVVVLDGDGIEQFRFGQRDSDPNLVFPCRIAIEEDLAGITLANETIVRERHLLVTDRYGLHRYDSRGRYLDRPVSTSELGFPVGAYSGLAISGYGEDSRLSVIDRTNGIVSRLRVVRVGR